MDTSRLIIRQWKPSDYEPFAQMNQDDEVMQFFPRKLTVQESNEMIEKSQRTVKSNLSGRISFFNGRTFDLKCSGDITSHGFGDRLNGLE